MLTLAGNHMPSISRSTTSPSCTSSSSASSSRTPSSFISPAPPPPGDMPSTGNWVGPPFAAVAGAGSSLRSHDRPIEVGEALHATPSVSYGRTVRMTTRLYSTQQGPKMSSPVYWWKLPFGRFVMHEIRRDGFRPFFIGLVASSALLGLGTMGASQEEKLKSPYYRLRMGIDDHGGH